MGDFLPGEPGRGFWARWAQLVVTVVAAVALVVGGMHFFTADQPHAAQGRGPADAESTAAAAVSVFSGTGLASDATLSAAARSANIPVDPVAGWDLPTTDGRSAQLVLPAGLGTAEPTPAGQVVYPDRGAGLSVIAENQGAGGRTITRIPQPAASPTSPPAGVSTTGGQVLPMVPMFLRTPADTVLLAHTNGIITLNQATPTATTIATIAAPQARDAHGQPVPSAFVTQQIRPGVYLLAQVIHPGPGTVWPVYADPCFSCWADNAVDAVSSAASTVAEGTVNGLKAAGTFVKNNPLESAEIIGGSVLVVTGVGSGFGASLVLSGTTGLVQKAAAADPTNTTLQAFGDGLEVANYLSPANDLRRGLTTIAERGVQKLGDDLAENALRDVTDIKPVTPTPTPQLANDIPKAPTDPLAGTPKAANAPPAVANSPGPLAGPSPAKPPAGHGPYGPRTLAKGCPLGCGHTTDVPVGVYDQREMPGTADMTGHYEANLATTSRGNAPTVFDKVTPAQARANRRAAQAGHPPAGPGAVNHEWPPASSAQGGRDAEVSRQPRDESDIEWQIHAALRQQQQVRPGDQYGVAYRGEDGVTRCTDCAMDRRTQQLRQQTSAGAMRNRAMNNARTSGAADRSAAQSHSRHGSSHDLSRGSGKKGKKQSSSHKKRKGQK